MLLKSRASLTSFRACFLPGRAKDVSATRYNIQWQFFFIDSRQTLTASSTHCHSSGFLQKLQCNWLYEVSCEVTAVGSCCGAGIFKQFNCCTVTVLGYLLWETNTVVECVTCQLLIQEVQIHVSSWGLAKLTYSRLLSAPPPRQIPALCLKLCNCRCHPNTPQSTSHW